MIDKTISHYKILEKLGQGGMGEVYLAEDADLKRKVALKFLTHQPTQEETRLRFKREAQAAAALNHPNIITVHEIGEYDGHAYIVMEYVKGRSLRELIDHASDVGAKHPVQELEKIEETTAGDASPLQPQPPLQIDQIIDIVLQICDGLAKAHQAGIVHRDLKPANIMIDQDGRVKILDFGLAKLKDVDRLTKTDTTLGTIYYMSPEQFRMAGIDQRSDIWSLGVMLYEMLTGQYPFKGEYHAAVMYAVLNSEPQPLSEVNPDIPEIFQPVIDRILNKNRHARYAHIEDLMADLKQEKKTASELLKPAKKASKKILKPSVLYSFALTILAILAAFIVFTNLPRQPVKVITPAHRQLTFNGNVFLPKIVDYIEISALSPDGQFVAYTLQKNKNKRVMVQDISGGQPIEILSGVEHVDPLRWSPEGHELMIPVFLNDTSSALFIFPRLGGKAQRIETFSPHSCWSPDGSQIAGSWDDSRSITFFNRTTGDTIGSIQLSGFHWFVGLDWSPLGDRLLFSAANESGTQFTIWTVKADGTQQKKVVEQNARLYSPRWAADGQAIYYLQSSGSVRDLMKIKISSASGTAEGEPQVLQTGLQAYGFSLSKDDRKLGYTKHLYYSNLWLVTREKNNQSGSISTQKLTSGTSEFFYPQISPAGKRIAFSHRGNIHVMPIEGGDMEQLTFLNSDCYFPDWSPDGREIAFISDGKVWRIPAAGGVPRAFENTDASEELAWAPGRDILYQRPGNRNFRFLNPQTGEERPLVTNDSVGWMFNPRYSPDGKSVAIHWNRWESDKDMRGGWLISLEDGLQTLLCKGLFRPINWSADGKWVYFWKPSESSMNPSIWKVAASGGDPQRFISLPFESIQSEGGITMTPDGQQIICNVIETHSDMWMIENFDPEVE